MRLLSSVWNNVRLHFMLPSVLDKLTAAINKLSMNDAVLQDMLRYESVAATLRTEIQVALSRNTDKYNACLPHIPQGDFDGLIDQIAKQRGSALTTAERDSIFDVWEVAKKQAARLSTRIVAGKEEQ